MRVLIKYVKTTTEEISVRIEDSRLEVLLTDEKETDLFKEVVEAAKKVVNLNSESK